MEENIAEQEIINRQGPRHKEMMKMNKILSERGLKVKEIPADGNW